MVTWNPNEITNSFFSLKLEPRQGGRIVSLKPVAGSELTHSVDDEELNRSRAAEHFGLLSVQLWQDSYWHNDICHKEWPITDVVETSTS